MTSVVGAIQHHQKPIRIVLEKRAFMVVWMTVFVLRNATMLALTAQIFYFGSMDQDTPAQQNWRRDVNALSSASIKIVRLMLFAFFLGHLHQLVEMLHATIATRTWVFRRRRHCRGSSRGLHSTQPHLRFRRALHFTWFNVFSSGRFKVSRQLSNAGDILVYCFGFLGIRSKWFNEVLTVRETIELIIQTMQVYRMQCMIANDFVNGAATVALFLGSISTALVEFWTKEYDEKSMKTRLVILMFDACMDFVFAAGMMLIIFLTLIPYMNFTTNTFLERPFYTDEWFITQVREFRQLSLSSGWDITSMIIFQLSLLYCLLRVQDLVVPRGIGEFDEVRRLDHDLNGPPLSGVASTSKLSAVRLLTTKLMHITPRCHAVIGTMALLASIYARFGTSEAVEGCKLWGYEWFKDHPVCIVMEINCNRRHTDGNVESIQEVLGTMDTEWLLHLIISHCTSLEIPTVITSVSSLFMLEVYNSTLKRWTAEASMTDSTNPDLTYLRFLYTNFTDGELPMGLRAKQPPSRLGKLAFIHTNLRTLPSELLYTWRPVLTLFMDHGELTDVPSVVSKLTSLHTLSVVDNNISSIPDGLLDDLTLAELYFSENPLTRLPERLAGSALTKSCSMSFEYTLLASIPPWLQQFLVEFQATDNEDCLTSLYGNPVCSNRVTRTMTDANTSLESIDWLLSKCFQDLQTRRGWSGLEYVQEQRTP